MSAGQDERLSALLDREAIRDCLYRYCRGIDRADEQALRSAYWPDAIDHHAAYNGPATGFIDQALPKLRDARMVHIIANILIEIRGEVAAVESSFVAWQQDIERAAGQADVAARKARETLLCGRYVDRFERRGGQWRIAVRTVVYDWIRQTPLPAPLDEAAFGRRLPTGGKAPQDPIYLLLAQLAADAPATHSPPLP